VNLEIDEDIMIDDFESIESLSKTFQEQVVSNQKKLNEVRRKQFQSMADNSSKIDFSKIREKHQEFQRREKSQISILAKELNKRLLAKVKIIEDNSFKMKELVQEKILLKELEKEHSNRITDALKTLSTEYDVPLMPLLVHVDMLLQKPELSEKQKNHLRNAKQNVLSCLDVG